MITAVPTTTAAEAAAARHWAANLRALSAVQGEVVDAVQSLAASGEWVFARDGSLTVLYGGQWLGGCSLPYRAGRAMMQSLDPRGSVMCFLAPLHAGEIQADLNRLSAQQAVIVLQPAVSVVRTILAAGDFAAAIDAGRLLFVTGDSWPDAFRSLFERHPGLPTPTQFIKLPTLGGEIADPLIAGAQHVFASINSNRADRIRVLRDAPRITTTVRNLAVIAGSKFGLWDDTGEQMASAVTADAAVSVSRLDPDQPLTAGPLATAEHCAKADALLTADVARCDFPDVLSKSLPWVTWVTRGRIPAYAGAGPLDALLVADAHWRDAAVKAGWPANRVDVAGFPAVARTATDNTFDGWTIIADTLPLAMPKKLDEFSSHKLLWEAIAAQLSRDPFVLDEPNAYLGKRCRAMNIDEATLDRRLFIDQLITPAYQQGLVRALIKGGVKLRIFGAGWGEIEEFRAVACGPIVDRASLSQALGSSRRLIHVWPNQHGHPIFATGLPVLRRRVSLLDAFVSQARTGTVAASPQQPVPPISLSRVLSVLGA